MSVLTGFSRGALAVEAAHPVDAGGAVEAGRPLAVVYVLRTVLPRPTVDADTGVAPGGVGASGPVVADTRPEGAFVYVPLAEFAAVSRGTEAPVPVHVIQAGSSVLAEVSWTVVHIFFAVVSSESCNHIMQQSVKTRIHA